jgi:hypothetical protein
VERKKNTLVRCANSTHQGIMEEVKSKINAAVDEAKLGFLLGASIFERTRYGTGNSLATNAPRGAGDSKAEPIA